MSSTTICRHHRPCRFYYQTSNIPLNLPGVRFIVTAEFCLKTLAPLTPRTHKISGYNQVLFICSSFIKYSIYQAVFNCGLPDMKLSRSVSLCYRIEILSGMNDKGD